MSQKHTKAIRVAVKDADVTKVKITFSGDSMFTVEEFTAVFMGLLEEYTKGMVRANGVEPVYDHWNRVFGIFLNRLLPEDAIYERDPAHKALREKADATLSAPEDREDTESNRLAAYVLCRDILVREVGLDAESADVILNRRLGLLPPSKRNAA